MIRQLNSGFVLLFTLLMILVISLLVVTCMHHLLLYQKGIAHQEERHQAFYQMESLAIQLVENGTSHCIEHGDLANEVIEILKHGKGCQLEVGRYQFRYVIEEIGDDPCLIIKNERGIFSSHHRRVSIKLISEGESQPILQIRYLSAVNAFTCLGESIEVHAGVSSWRYLA